MVLTRRNAKFVIPLLGVVAVLLIVLRGPSTPDRAGRAPDAGQHVEAEARVWTCSMHPQVRQDRPGDCPICGMDLIPVEGGTTEEAGAERRLVVSAAAKGLMDISTSRVERRRVDQQVTLAGRVAYDEGLASRIAAWVPGRIDRLHVNSAGAVVERGQPMVDLYSPGLLAAQEELLQSLGALSRAEGAATPAAARAAGATLDAVRERLSLWGLSDEQISEIEERGTAEPVLTILAPADGTVIGIDATEGAYVSTGSTIYSIVDLSRVWIELDAYESDLARLGVGQVVDFSVDAYPGERFRGEISFIDPVVDATTRAVTVRVEADNSDGLFKPDMFVRATVQASYRGDGAPLVIPDSAPLLTGTRAVVYVEVPGTDSPTYEGREVVLGPRAGDYYVVRSGLTEGEIVVTEGGFKIDSALQIRAKPSMMNPEGEGGAGVRAHHGDGSVGEGWDAGEVHTSDADAREGHAH
jgi:Cu(I)/Ag(I) efflux system membrane fusion protein